MTALTAEQQRKVDELAERVADAGRRWADAQKEMKVAMRARGEPVRDDFPNRAAYRSALARFRRRGPA